MALRKMKNQTIAMMIPNNASMFTPLSQLLAHHLERLDTWNGGSQVIEPSGRQMTRTRPQIRWSAWRFGRCRLRVFEVLAYHRRQRQISGHTNVEWCPIDLSLVSSW
jgi:hypothetical protein